VDAAAPRGPAGHREVDIGEGGGAALELALAIFDRALEFPLQGVRGPANLSSCVRIETGEGLENIGEGTGLAAQELGFELLEPACVRVRDLFETLPQRV
jgi:hypothetical protein